MAHHRAYLLDHDRHVISVANLQCADEQEARERAQQLVDVNDIELWQLDRRIAVFEAATSRTSQATGQGRPQQEQRLQTNEARRLSPGFSVADHGR
jgi:hypothetical protein